MANSFIGLLVRKYSKTNHGFIGNYETAMCIWASATKESKNVTIYHLGIR